MRTPEETRAAIKHLYAAREGAIRACAPPRAGVEMEGNAEKMNEVRDENRARVNILSRMIDALQWSLGEPSELSEWITQFEKVDRIDKMGFAGRLS